MGNFLTMGSDVCRFTGNFLGGILSLPLVSIALVGAYLHFVYEERFNEDPLCDLVARPARVPGQVLELAA